MKLQNQSIWGFKIGIWKVCLRGFAPQTYFSIIKFKISNCLILQFYPMFDFFSKISFKVSGKKHFFGWSLTVWLCKNRIRRLVSQFPSFRSVSTKSEISSIWPIFDSNLYYFSSDQKTVNIGQIAMSRNVEMERNTLTFCFRRLNVKIPLILRATLEN